MNKYENFNLLVDKAMQVTGHSQMRPAIEKELLHYDILFSLDKEGLLDKLTFQGGTSLRLCYGAQRLSEDLDFVGGRDFATSHLLTMKQCLEKYIGERYGLAVTVKKPKDMQTLAQYQDIKVDKWQISITTTPEKRDIPKQRIKLEVANVPAYSRVPLALKQNYDFLPDGYSDTLIMTETLDEIMADKLISLVCCQRYLRYRDIWDLRWLKQQGSRINFEYITSKIQDYKESEYSEKLKELINKIDEIIRSKEFKNEMLRFIPINVIERTLHKDKFIDFLANEIKSTLFEVERGLQV